ncbi:20S proteasome subunit A/B [Haloplanus sp. GCM10025708]|uniref:20S proteasome subunit A/B n=1 Tax=Haloferacaceae TaxID=1644056 RepID=UPI0036162D6B
MSTIVGVDCPDGALLAGDRLLVSGGQVRSQSKRHVFEFDGVAAAAVGDDVDAFERRLDAALREYRTERGSVDIETLTRLTSDVTADVGVDAVVAARDDSGAHVRGVDRSGATFDDTLVAFGSGAQFVLGSLEREEEEPLDATETRVREAFAAAAERDAGTGAEIDVVSIE